LNPFQLRLYSEKTNIYFMKNLFLTLLIITSVSLLNAQTKPPRKVQLVLLIDASNSMDGLIEQAKSRLWAIVNEASSLKFNGVAPVLEIAVYDYGNSGINDKNYVRLQTNFTSDLDVVSEKLFALRTNGGEEYCGAVIEKSLQELLWSRDPNDLLLIYIAGNEPFNQGPVNYKSICTIAKNRGVFINTIYCGEYQQGVKESWKDGATCSNGEYFNINSDAKIAAIPTPYDDQIIQLNKSLNTTYMWYGEQGVMKKSNQGIEDKNALNLGSNIASERALVKSKSAYNNASWDVVDAFQADSTKILELKDDQLPEELQGMGPEEKATLINAKTAERARIQAEIQELGKQREVFISKINRNPANGEVKDDFGSAVNKSMKEKAILKGFN